jgi:hypothetical protein
MGINYGSLDITTTGAGTFSAVVMSSSTPSSITNTLYNDGGTLKFGSQVVYTDLSEIPEDLVPSFDGIFDLGSTTKKWFKGYFTSEIQIGNTATIQADVDDDIVINTNVIVQGISSATIGDFGDITISDNNIELNSSLGSYGPQIVNISPGLNVDGDLKLNGEPISIVMVRGTGRCSVLANSNLNTASGNCSTVSGGCFNKASGYTATIGGGLNNTASGCYSVVAGGGSCFFGFINYGNTASGNCSTVGGGVNNTASANQSTVSGGRSNTASGAYSFVGGGAFHVANATYSTLGGGQTNCASGDCSTIGGGYTNTASGSASTVSGGFSNCAIGTYSIVGGGRSNRACGCVSTVSGGFSNCATAECSTVGGGYLNRATGNCSTVGGGYFNTASGCASTVSGGCCNFATGCFSGVLGGCRNGVSHESSFIVGSFLTSTAACYTFVNNLCNVGGGTSDCRLKENIKTLTYGVKELSKLEPVAFNFKDDESKKTKYGFLAQCVQNVMPELIYHHPTDKVDNTPVLQFDKEAIWASMINAIKELHDKNIALEERIKKLENTK